MRATLAEVLSQKQVMEQLGVSRTTLWRWRRSGKLQSYKLSPRKIGFSPAHIQALLQISEEKVGDGEN